MLLYTEAQLEKAWRIDCKARSSCDKAWIKPEEFRPIYEKLIELYMRTNHPDSEIFNTEIPEYLIDSVNDLIEATLTLDI
tara:strand:+ start:1342 stop:1581 length:240 start_codon:yes stop_codon:yes gene_type:complete